MVIVLYLVEYLAKKIWENYTNRNKNYSDFNKLGFGDHTKGSNS